MSVEITSIAGAGDLDRERIILKALADDEIGDYIVFRTRAASDDGKPLSTNIPNAFWFPNLKIKKGDFIVLYSKDGSRRAKSTADESTSYFFYWGLEKPIWSEPKHRAILLHATSWTTFRDGPEE
jgi:hypothetical protein